MQFLLDSNVVSELRKNRPHGAVVAWLQSIPPDDIGIPAIVLGELQAGAEITRKQDQQKAAEIDQWIDRIARIWQVVELDAAIARVYKFTVVTRNTKDFESFDIELLNPFHFQQGNKA